MAVGVVSKQGLGPAPCLILPPAPKLDLGVDPSKARHRVSGLLSPSTRLTRPEQARYSDASPGRGATALPSRRSVGIARLRGWRDTRHIRRKAGRAESGAWKGKSGLGGAEGVGDRGIRGAADLQNRSATVSRDPLSSGATAFSRLKSQVASATCAEVNRELDRSSIALSGELAQYTRK